MSQNETCPRTDALLLDELGELAVNKSVALRQHEDTCAACRAARADWRRTMGDLASVPSSSSSSSSSSPADAQAFVARVEAAARARSGHEEARAPRWLRGRGATFAVAAALVLLAPAALVLGLRVRGGGDAGDGTRSLVGTVSARGRAAGGSRVGAELLLVRDGRLRPLEGETVCGAEALAVRVTNLSGRAVHVMAFGRDAAGDVHWLYPAFVDPRTNPASVSIADGITERVLGELVQPEAPASGPMRFVTLLSSDPLTVKDVELRLGAADRAATFASLFPNAVAREWTARCETRR